MPSVLESLETVFVDPYDADKARAALKQLLRLGIRHLGLQVELTETDGRKVLTGPAEHLAYLEDIRREGGMMLGFYETPPPEETARQARNRRHAAAKAARKAAERQDTTPPKEDT
jgi:hypothetical protein